MINRYNFQDLFFLMFGGIVLEEALDLLSDRILNEWMFWNSLPPPYAGQSKETNFKCLISAGLITNYTLIQETVLVGMSRSFMGHSARECEWERRLTVSFPSFFWSPWHFQAFLLTVFLFLDPGGFVHVPPVFILKYSTFCPHSLFLCFVQFTEQTMIISQYRNNKVVFICGMECVYCAVQNKSLNNSD